MTTILYGASDDCVEVEGDFYDEYPHTSDYTDVMFVVDGYLLTARIVYAGEWRILLAGHEDWDYIKYDAGTPMAVKLCDNDYSDVLVVNEPVELVFAGRAMERNTRDR